MEERNGIGRRNNAIGMTSLIALLAIAGLIALIIWQPWTNASMDNTSTTLTQGAAGR
jgi:hypothetical protein